MTRYFYSFITEAGKKTLGEEMYRRNKLTPNNFKDEMNFYGTDEDVRVAQLVLDEYFRKPIIHDAGELAKSSGSLIYGANPLSINSKFILKFTGWLSSGYSTYNYNYNCHSLNNCHVTSSR